MLQIIFETINFKPLRYCAFSHSLQSHAKKGFFPEDRCISHGLEQHVTMKTQGDNILDLIMSDYLSDVKVRCKPPLGASDVTLMAEFPPPPPPQVSEERPTKRVF